MKYKIIVDKQSRSNPSSEKKEYEIDIEELHCRGDIYDSLVITKDEDYVMRRLQKNEYNVLNILEQPIKEPLSNINIELFEGDNYIYLLDITGNKIYAEYLVKSDFTDLYVTKNEMNSAINETAGKIELTVNQKLTEYATGEDLEGAITTLNSTITQKANEITSTVSNTYATKSQLNTAKSEIKQTTDNITSTVSKKVGNNEIISKINQSPETVDINASKININGVVSANGNFKVDTQGNMTCNNGTFTGGSIELKAGQEDNGIFRIYDPNTAGTVDGHEFWVYPYGMSLGAFNKSVSINFPDDDTSPLVQISGRNYKQTLITADKVDTPKLHINDMETIASGSNDAQLYLGTSSKYSGKTTNLRGNTVRLYSHSSGAVYLGTSGSTAITSDENLKDISEIDEKYIEFFKNLKPITYIYKNKGHRSHIGFGARQVEEALRQAGLTTEQFAGVLKNTDVTISADEAETEKDVHYDELYSLRYEEFIALNTMIIQKQAKEIEDLKTRIEKLEEVANAKN